MQATAAVSPTMLTTSTWLSSRDGCDESLSRLAASLQRRDGRNTAAAASATASFASALLALREGDGATSVAALQQHLASIEATLRATSGAAYAAFNVLRRVRAVLAEEAVKAVASAAPAGAPGAAGAAGAAASAASAAEPADRASAVAAARRACASAVAAAAAAAGTGAAVSAPAPSDSSSSSAALQQPLSAAARESVLDALIELRDELELSSATIASSAAESCFAHGDVVLVCGYDAAVRDALLAAARRRRLGEVIVCEGAACGALAAAAAGSSASSPVLAGHALAAELTSRAKPLSVTLVPDAAAAAVMHRVTRVLLGARAVAADGAVLADAPAALLALAAAARAVPVVVLANALAFCPRAVAADAASLERLAASLGGADANDVLPARAVAAAEAAYAAAVCGAAGDGGGDDAAPPQALLVLADDLDVLPASAVATIVTNAGIFAPAQASRVLEELYGEA